MNRPALWIICLACPLICSQPVRAQEQALQAAPTSAQIEFFEKYVRPLLIERCWKCHGPLKQEGGLRLDSSSAIARGGDSGPAVDVKTPGQSLLIEAIQYAPDAVVQMPPDGKLAPSQIVVFKRWVHMGAPWPTNSTDTAKRAPANRESHNRRVMREHWAYQTATKPKLPDVKDLQWSRSPIDRFILAKLEASDLRPAPRAEKRVLLRRATYDLHGLPPTARELDRFLADDSPEAFDRVVDRLLASPRYGERWGRHWLDVARYADSNGMDENLAYANAYRYRDYVIGSFNVGKPYDQFVREQLAGDLLPNDERSSTAFERLIATGFLVIGPKMLAEDDPVKMQMDIVDEQIDSLGRAFLGMSFGCARCHDHKFDPFPTQDYYSLAGVFKSTKAMENYKVVARWYERPVAPRSAIERLEAHTREVAKLGQAIELRTKTATETLLQAERRKAGRYLLAAAELIAAKADGRSPESLMANAKDSRADGAEPIVVEAEDFAHGNVKTDFDHYGKSIGVLVNIGELPNVAEYQIRAPNAGSYQIELRVAAASARPTKLIINGSLVKSDAADIVTGSWTPESQSWCVAGTFRLRQGENTIRLEREGPFPHFDKLAVIPLQSSSDDVAMRLKTPSQFAVEYDLQLPFLHQWIKYVKQTSQAPDSIFAAWQPILAATPTPEEDEPTSTIQALNRRLDAFRAESRHRLADRYAELFSDAQVAWKNQIADGAGAQHATLADPVLEAFRKVLYDPSGPFSVPKDVSRSFPHSAADEIKRLKNRRKRLEASSPVLPHAMTVEEGTPSDVRVHIRGNHLNLGESAPRRMPRFIAGGQPKPVEKNQSGRLALAKWITQPAHPLTARVMVNRIWRWHFGAGIVRTPDNFGTTGDVPVHRDLLDWLAVTFVESGWSIKALHREIMLSATYQLASANEPHVSEIDPENRLHAHAARRRLEAEAIRDSVLAGADVLDLTMGGSLLETENRKYVTNTSNRNYDKYESTRRSVYLPVVRSALYDLFQTFDFPDPSMQCGDRTATTIAPQALFMLNSDFIDRHTATIARSMVARKHECDSRRLRAVYEKLFLRRPTNAELTRARDFLVRLTKEWRKRDVKAAEAHLRAWHSLCRVLIASHEFITVE